MPTPITPLPDPPSRSDRANFAERGDAFMAALAVFANELNTYAAALGAGLVSTSATSLTVGTGSKTWTVATGLAYVAGMEVVAAVTATPTTRLVGTVTAYDSGTGALTVSVSRVSGSGTHAAWTISMSAAVDLYDLVTKTGTETLTNKTLTSPALTGTPTAPTASVGTNTTQVATTAFVQAAVSALLASAPGALDTLNELAAALGNDANFATTITNALALKAPLASPALTGTPTVPTAAAGTDTTQAASTAYALAASTGRVKLTAQGAIAQGQVVVINSNGTASEVGTSETAATLGAEQTLVSSDVSYYDRAIEIPGTDKMVLMYTGYLVVAQLNSDDTMTLGTPVAFADYATASMCWHATENSLVVGYVTSGTQYLVLGTVSGTALTLGTPSSGGGVTTGKVAIAYNAQQNKIAIAYLSSSTAISARAAHVASGVVTWYTAVSVESSMSSPQVRDMLEIPGTPYLLLLRNESSSTTAKGTVIGINATVTTVYASTSTFAKASRLAFAAAASAFVACSDSNGNAFVITVSGTTPTVGSSQNTGLTLIKGLAYDAQMGRVVAFGTDGSGYALCKSCTVTALTLSASASTTINAATTDGMVTGYNATRDRVLFAYRDQGALNYGNARLFNPADLLTNADSWIGIADAAISDAAQGWITLRGGLAKSVSGLAAGQRYYIDDAGALQQTGSRPAGLALAADKLLLLGNA